MSRPLGIASDKLVAALDRGSREQVQVRRCRHRSGVDYIDVRIWSRTWGSEPYKPGKGITLRLDELAAVAEALEKAATK